MWCKLENDWSLANLITSALHSGVDIVLPQGGGLIGVSQLSVDADLNLIPMEPVNAARPYRISEDEFRKVLREQAEINKKAKVEVATKTISRDQMIEANEAFMKELSRPTNRQMFDDHEKRIKALEERLAITEEILNGLNGVMSTHLVRAQSRSVQRDLKEGHEAQKGSSISLREASLEIGHLKERVSKLEGVRTSEDSPTPNRVAHAANDANGKGMWLIEIDPRASPKNLPFSVALEYLKSGRSIRRTAWPEKGSMRIAPRKDALVFYDPAGLTHYAWAPSTFDFLATDWEVLPE